jgi:signal transduction histidine kinase
MTFGAQIIARSRELWLPILVTLLGAAAAYAVSDRLERERQREIERSARAIAAESRAAIAHGLYRQRAAVEDLARSWARFQPPLPDWTDQALRTMRNVSAIRSIAWVSLGSEPLRAAQAPNGRPPLPLDEADARTHAGDFSAAGPLRRSDGGFSYRLYQPIPPVGSAAGVLVAGVHADELLERVLRDVAPGYAISVFWADAEIASRGRPDRSPELGWWRGEGEVALAPGAVWRVVHEPTPELAEKLLTPLPNHLLVAGLLLSACAGVIVFQLLRSLRNARALAAANRALDVDMREAREGEATLRRLSEELEQRVRQRTAQLEDTLSEIEAFNFSVSHDLRSPIGAVLNFVAILEEDYCPQLPPSGRELVTRIRGSAERAIELLEGLLKLSRAGRTTLELERLDMAALVREAFPQARGDDSGTIELEVGPLPPAHGDRVLIGSVFVNLLANAVKYTRGLEKRRIVVSGTTADRMNVYAVTDSGIGFDDRFAAKLFRAFERLHPSDRYEGAGIGLALVARIVQRHGGRVWAEGQPDAGASFFFSLPPAVGEAP